MEWLLLGVMAMIAATRSAASKLTYADIAMPDISASLWPDQTLTPIQTPVQAAQPATWGQTTVPFNPFDTSWYQYINWPTPQEQSYMPQQLDVSPAGLAFIRQQEGLRLSPYKDSAGHWTIGYGHKIVSGDPYYPAGTVRSITADQAEQLFQSDVQQAAANYVRGYVTVPLTQAQFDALTSLVYNIGAGNFSTSTLLVNLNTNDYNGAANQFTRWVYSGGSKDPVLMQRRAAEKSMFLGS